MEADHGRTGILDDLAHGLVERRAAPARCRRPTGPARPRRSTAPGFRASACAASSGAGATWLKKLTLNGAPVCARMSAIWARSASAPSAAQASEPRPPAWQTATASGLKEPTIGAWIRGSFDGRDFFMVGSGNQGLALRGRECMSRSAYSAKCAAVSMPDLRSSGSWTPAPILSPRALPSQPWPGVDFVRAYLRDSTLAPPARARRCLSA